MTHFITSKYGKIDKFNIYVYKFSNELLEETERKQKFISWLKRSEDNNLFRIDGNSFLLFNRLIKNQDWQYSFEKDDWIAPPFKNTQQISSYLSSLVRDSFSLSYKRFLNYNIFETSSIEYSLFNLRRCVEFNIEAFENGSFFIHLKPTDKTTSNANVSGEFLTELKNASYNKHANNLLFTIINKDNFYREKFDLLSIENMSDANDFIKKNKNCLATFDYHFISLLSYDIFSEIIKYSTKDNDKTIPYLEDIIRKLKLPETIKTNQKPFFRITPSTSTIKNNLIVGNNMKVSKQSSAFYNGIYKPVTNGCILPIIVDNYCNQNKYKTLIERFNGNDNNLTVLPSKIISSNGINDFSEILELKQKHGYNLLLSIFTQYEQPNKIFQPLYDVKAKIQIYLGAIDDYKLSNYTIKCLEKLGGQLNIISNTYEPNTTYFVGLDLGHSNINEKKHSNLGMAFFRNDGILLTKFVEKELPRNEALMPKAINKILTKFSDFIQKNKYPGINKLIIHRDGKLHHNDINVLIEEGGKLSINNLEIIEIIKSGYPIFAKYDKTNKRYSNADSGEYWMFEEHKYAILSTNVQAKEINSFSNPIIIKHKFGDSEFYKIIEQVY